MRWIVRPAIAIALLSFASAIQSARADTVVTFGFTGAGGTVEGKMSFTDIDNCPTSSSSFCLPTSFNITSVPPGFYGAVGPYLFNGSPPYPGEYANFQFDAGALEVAHVGLFTQSGNITFNLGIYYDQSFNGATLFCDIYVGGCRDVTDRYGGLSTRINGPVTFAVPASVVGAGLPGLIFASGGLLGWWRRKNARRSPSDYFREPLRCGRLKISETAQTRGRGR